MPAFLKVRRNQLIIGGVVILLLIAGGALFFITRSSPKTTSSHSSAGASVSPSPSARPSTAPSAPAPGPTAATIGIAGALLKSGQAADDTSTLFGNGPGCSIWNHPGWTQDACAIVQVSGTDQAGAVAWITEHKGTGRRVSVMTAASGAAYWMVKLYAIDDPGGSYTAITVKAADVTGDGQPEIFVGFRAVGTGHVLELDGVQRLPGTDPKVIIHRELVMGHAVLAGGGLTDYSASGSAYTKTVITYSGGAFHGTSSTVPASSVPAGDFA